MMSLGVNDSPSFPTWTASFRVPPKGSPLLGTPPGPALLAFSLYAPIVLPCVGLRGR